LVKKVHVVEGQTVKKGQVLLTLFNRQSLRTYTLVSPTDGDITQRFVNTGDHADKNILLEVTDLSSVWIELSAFPHDIETLAKGQDVWVYDMHQHNRTKGKIIYVAPIMTEGHIARARAILSNKQQHWRPGMHIKADINIDTPKVPLAVKTSALQRLEGKSVVFTKEGNQFDSRPVVLGKSDQLFTEIISGLSQGDEYVSENSFIIKADIKKNGASHDH
jgi:cobalt-zinc-cadmium efflux system membrane fusion protein